MDLSKHELRKTRTNKIATCKSCGTTRRIEVLSRRWFNASSKSLTPTPSFERIKINGIPSQDSRTRELLTCCGSALPFKAIKGKVTDHKCGAKCRSAKGGDCECSCGGKHHGENHC